MYKTHEKNNDKMTEKKIVKYQYNYKKKSVTVKCEILVSYRHIYTEPRTDIVANKRKSKYR